MLVEGFSNPSHILKSFIANEYAFSFYLKDKEIRVAHHKGTWTFAKLKDGILQDHFEWYDTFSGCLSQNELTHSFISSIQKGAKGDISRNNEAAFIIKALEVWAGPLQEIVKVSVVQPGRNAWVDNEGEFKLSASPNEFYA